MRQDMLRVFPQLADVKVDYAWGGFCDITVNRAPDLGRLAGNIYYMQGFPDMASMSPALPARWWPRPLPAQPGGWTCLPVCSIVISRVENGCARLRWCWAWPIIE
jgi:hypothetical protein